MFPHLFIEAFKPRRDFFFCPIATMKSDLGSDDKS